MFCMDLRPHVCAFMRSRLSAKIYGVLLWACACVWGGTVGANFCVALTLLTAVVAALWSVSPTGGPRCAGWVCGGGVIVVSPGSWVLRFEKSQSEHGIQPFVRASIHIPNQTADQERERAGRGGWVGGWVGREGVGMEQQRKRKTTWVCWKSESAICKRVDWVKTNWGSLACFHYLGKGKEHRRHFPSWCTTKHAAKIKDGEKETDAQQQLAISQNTLIKVFH